MRVVAVISKDGKALFRYVINWDDFKQRKVFGRQAEAALRDGCTVITRPIHDAKEPR